MDARAAATVSPTAAHRHVSARTRLSLPIRRLRLFPTHVFADGVAGTCATFIRPERRRLSYNTAAAACTRPARRRVDWAAKRCGEGLMLKDFKAFILRGNVVDLAIGVAIGAAFTMVVTSFTKNILTPILAIFGGKRSFGSLILTINHAQIRYGGFLDDLIAFVITAAILFFGVVRPVNLLMNRRKTEPEVVATTRDCPYCLSSIPVGATRCAFCTADLASAPG
jgi:large conductance mechanosensitive channel